MKRNYVPGKGATQTSSKASFGLDFTKILSTAAPISLGQLMANLPRDTLDDLLATVHQLSQKKEPPKTSADATEAAVVQAAVAHSRQASEQNLFAPFHVAEQSTSAGAKLGVTLHWGNVDTGSMVNIIYSGVLSAFPALLQYKHPFTHIVKGVGGKTSTVTCKLVDVPLSIGREQEPGSWVTTTFYVLDCA